MHSLRVFLVENHEDTVRYMQLYLEQLSYKVTVGHGVGPAGDSRVALRRADQ